MNQYHKGDLVRLNASFRDENGDAIDPSTVTFKVKTPAAVTTSYVYGTDSEVVKVATGDYKVEIIAAESGTYYYRIESTGSGRAADESSFTVATSNF